MSYKKERVSWIKMQNPPRSYSVSNAVSFNNDEFIVASFAKDTANSIDGIYKYNVSKDQWALLIQFPTSNESVWSNHQTICIDYHNQIVYTYVAGKEFYEIDIKKETFKELRKKYIGIGMSIYFVNNECHLFPTRHNKSHTIWNKMSQEFESINQSKPFRSNYELVYNEKEQYFLYFGGCPLSKSILKYSIIDRNWEELDFCEMPVRMYSFGCIITDDCQFVITFGGLDAHSQAMNNIFILNLNSFKWIESSFKVPFFDPSYAILTCSNANKSYNVELLVSGYIYSLKLDPELMNAFPNDLVLLIMQFHIVQFVHVLRRLNRGSFPNHWKIKLSELLS